VISELDPSRDPGGDEAAQPAPHPEDGELQIAMPGEPPRLVPGVDTDDDGRADTVVLDDGSRGGPLTIGRDGTGDGRVDVIGWDTNNDGRIDVVIRDPDGTGEWTEPQPLQDVADEVPELAAEAGIAPVLDERPGLLAMAAESLQEGYRATAGRVWTAAHPDVPPPDTLSPRELLERVAADRPDQADEIMQIIERYRRTLHAWGDVSDPPAAR
jgi:hypothetical protein